MLAEEDTISKFHNREQRILMKKQPNKNVQVKAVAQVAPIVAQIAQEVKEDVIEGVKIESKPKRKWRAKPNQIPKPVVQGDLGYDLLAFEVPKPIATTIVGEQLLGKSNLDSAGMPITAPVYDSYQNGKWYARALLDTAGTPEGCHIPEDGDTIINRTRKLETSTAIPVYNGTVGCDGSVAVIVRGDPVNTYSIGSVAADHLVTFGAPATSSAWVSMKGSDLTGDHITRPICAEVYLEATTFGEIHTLNGVQRVLHPSSATSSTTGLTIYTNTGLTTAEKAYGGEEEPSTRSISIRIASFKARGINERHSWIDALTDRGTSAGETRVGVIYGLRSTDQPRIRVAIMYEQLPDDPTVTPLATGTVSAVRGSSVANDLTNAAVDGIDRFSGMIGETTDKLRAFSLKNFGKIGPIFDKQSMFDFGAKFAAKIAGILGGNSELANWAVSKFLPSTLPPSATRALLLRKQLRENDQPLIQLVNEDETKGETLNADTGADGEQATIPPAQSLSSSSTPSQSTLSRYPATLPRPKASVSNRTNQAGLL